MPVTLSKTEVLDIPIELIRENPENPRGPVSPESAQVMAESLKEAGQKTEIRVRRLTEAEYPPCEYLLIGGHVRLAGAKLAGLPTLRAIVVEGIAPGQELLAALLDNRWEDMGWWQWDLAIEKLLSGEQAPTQRELAAQLGWHESKISRVMKIMMALNPGARELVRQNLASQDSQQDEKLAPRKSKNKVFLITESILLALADLEDPQQVERALRQVLDDHLTEAKVKGLVEWVKVGNPPETFQSNAAPSKPAAGSKQAQTSQPTQPSPLAGEGQGEGDTAKGAQASPNTQISQASKIGAWITADQFLKEAKRAFGRVAGGVFSRFLGAFHFVNNWFQKRGVKSPVVATILTAFLALWLGGFVIDWGCRLLGRGLLYAYFARPTLSMSKGPAVSSSNGPNGSNPAPESLSVPTQNPKLNTQNSLGPGGPVSQPVQRSFSEGGSPKGDGGSDQMGVESGEGDTAKANGSNGSNGPSNPKTLASVSSSSVHGLSVDGGLSSNGVSLAPQLKGQVAGVEVVEKGLGINVPFGGNSSSQTSHSKLLTPNSKFKEPYVPEELMPRIEGDKAQAEVLAKNFYAFSYKLDFGDWYKFFDCVADNYVDEFDAKYYSKARLEAFKENKMYFDFVQSAPPRLAKIYKNTDDIAVEGTVTTLSDVAYPNQALSTRRTALVITFYHNPDNTWAVTKIKEAPAP